MDSNAVGNASREIQRGFFNSFEKMMYHIDDIYVYENCESMADVAYDLIENGVLGEIPANLINYIDYDAFGRDLEIEGNYLITSHGIFEYNGQNVHIKFTRYFSNYCIMKTNVI